MFARIPRQILEACEDLSGASAHGFVPDHDLAKLTGIRLRDLRDYLLVLDEHGLVELARTLDGFSAYIGPQGRLVLNQNKDDIVLPSSQDDTILTKLRVLRAILDGRDDSSGFVLDVEIAKSTLMRLRDVRDYLMSLNDEAFIELARLPTGFTATITAKGRLKLRMYDPFPDDSEEQASASRVDESASLVGSSSKSPGGGITPQKSDDSDEVGGCQTPTVCGASCEIARAFFRDALRR